MNDIYALFFIILLLVSYASYNLGLTKQQHKIAKIKSDRDMVIAEWHLAKQSYLEARHINIEACNALIDVITKWIIPSLEQGDYSYTYFSDLVVALTTLRDSYEPKV